MIGGRSSRPHRLSSHQRDHARGDRNMVEGDLRLHVPQPVGSAHRHHEVEGNTSGVGRRSQLMGLQGTERKCQKLLGSLEGRTTLPRQ